MTKQELEARLKAMEDDIARLKDIEEIKKLQRIYGYYLEHWQWQEVVDLFSDSPDASIELSDWGVYIGKEKIRGFFYRENVPPELLHLLMQLSGVVDIDPDGKTARGRWYGFGCLAVPTGKEVVPYLSSGIYENEYIKENGKWKIKKMQWSRNFNSPYKDGWVKSPEPKLPFTTVRGRERPEADLPTTFYHPYPSGRVFPYHYKHPVTGR